MIKNDHLINVNLFFLLIKLSQLFQWEQGSTAWCLYVKPRCHSQQCVWHTVLWCCLLVPQASQGHLGGRFPLARGGIHVQEKLEHVQRVGQSQTHCFGNAPAPPQAGYQSSHGASSQGTRRLNSPPETHLHAPCCQLLCAQTQVFVWPSFSFVVLVLSQTRFSASFSERTMNSCAGRWDEGQEWAGTTVFQSQ